MLKKLFLLCSLMSPASCAWGVDAPQSPDLPYTAERLNPVTYDVDYSMIVTAPYKTKLLKVWLPLPPNDAGQTVSASELSTFPAAVKPSIVAEPIFQNRFAYFEFSNPQGAQIIRHQFSIKVWELRWHLDAGKVAAPKQWPESFAPYQRSESQAVVVGEGHKALIAQILAQRSGAGFDMAKVMDYTRRTFRYDHQVASLRGDSTHLLTKGQGHCSDYHGFCAAVGRALGYPTRITYGINTFPKNSPSHCKLEAFLPPYGWVSFDVSETQKLTTAVGADNTLDAAMKQKLIDAAVQRLESGFRDNTWFLQTRGSDYELAPPASRCVPVVRTIYAEADGAPLADPDPGNPTQREFSWMTAAKFTADHPVTYPFTDVKSLESGIERR